MSEVSEEEIRRRWPLHWLIWNDDHEALERLLQEKEVRRIREAEIINLSVYRLRKYYVV